MNSDRILGPLRALVRQFTAHLDYYALYPAQIVTQNGDGTLDVTPEDTRVPPMQGVPIRYGLPGVKAKVASGGRVLLGFEGGNPQRPIVTLWDFSGISSIHFDEGTHSIARQGDTATIGYLSGAVQGTAVAFTLTPAAPPTGLSIKLTATIDENGIKVKA